MRLRPFICAKIERPSPPRKPSCKVRLFAQIHFHEYRQKVTATTLFQTAFHPVFNFSHKRPTFALTPESGYTLAFRRRIAHNGSHGETEGLLSAVTALSCVASEIVTERTAGGSGCTPMACVRFLRRRGPAGLRSPCRRFLLLLKTFVANSLAPWYYGVDESKFVKGV